VKSARPTLDLRGVRCPLSWAKAKVHLETLAAGVEIDLLLDDPQGARDLPRAAEAAGHHVVHVVQDGPAAWTITIEV
jgi:TusA-related sulfurtransferase